MRANRKLKQVRCRVPMAYKQCAYHSRCIAGAMQNPGSAVTVNVEQHEPFHTYANQLGGSV